jgi:hypothetical protein
VLTRQRALSVGGGHNVAIGLSSSEGRSGMKRIGGSIREQVEEESKGMSIVCASEAGEGR